MNNNPNNHNSNRPVPQRPPRDIRNMSNLEVQKVLGEQYAQTLKDNRDLSAYKDCKEVIEASMAVMEHYNRIALQLKRAPRKIAGIFG